MATISNGYLGAFEGSLGPAVGYLWNGRPCVRSKPGYVRNPRTQAQQDGRRQFAAVTSLASAMGGVMVVGLRGAARRRKVTPYNLFASLNRQCVALDDERVVVDYPMLRVSEGPLAPLDFEAPQLPSPLTVEVEFRTPCTSRRSMGSDYVYLYAFAPDLGYGRLSLPVHRAQHRLSLPLPAAFAGHEVQLYGFAWDLADASSPSTWIGSIVV